MNKSLLAIVVSILLSSLAAAAPISSYTIVVSRDAIPAEKRGATELQQTLGKITSSSINLISDDQPLPTHAILVGSTQFSHVDPNQKLGPEQYRIQANGDHLLILGGRPRGVMYGCTALLEALGVRYFTPTCTFIPSNPKLEMPDLNLAGSPAFEYREVYIWEAFDKDWSAHLRLNGQSHRLDESTGGKITYYPFVHTFDALFPRSLFATHPEYFPLIKGKRTNGYVQRCLTNPALLQMAIAGVEGWINSHPSAMIYSVSQNDTYNFCECDNCKAIEAKYGGHVGLYLWFVNQVAQAIEKDHPDKLIDTLAYQFTEPPPTNITPRKNVRIRLCPIFNCYGHPFDTDTAKPTIAFMHNLKGWAALTDTLYIWHYNTNFHHFLLPFPDFHEFPANLKLYKKSGVRGVFFEGSYGAGGCGSDSDLRSYVMAKLLWDPEQDADAVVNEWMAGVYGPAAKPMRAWFDLLHQQIAAPDHHLFIYDRPNAQYLNPKVIEAGDRLFDEAEKLAEPNPIAKQYIFKARLSLRYTKFAQAHTPGPAFDAFVTDLEKLGVRDIREGQTVAAWAAQYRHK